MGQIQSTNIIVNHKYGTNKIIILNLNAGVMRFSLAAQLLSQGRQEKCDIIGQQ